ncbi:cytoglobin-1 [Diabrotica virgifera virgifera]|nr:cytoglobin-1 [Diabrotica virgifera virgifera]
MGPIWSAFGATNTGRTDDADSTTGLTSRDRYLLKSSWAGVMKNPTDNGVALLLLMFKKFPETKTVFPFKDIPNEELANNVRFRAHCNSVVYAITSMVDAIDDPSLLVGILEKVGRDHKRRSIPQKYFEGLQETIIELFSTFMKPNEINSWNKALGVIFKVVADNVK